MKLGKINRQSIGISGFTSVLKNYEGMPKEVYVAGTLPKTPVHSVAIVGSRRPTAYGKEVTHRLAYDLAKRGVVIVSGLAYGVDAIAHQAALEAGGTTVAVLANGLHRVYPAGHTALAETIIQRGGALISEQPPGVDAHPYHFLSRNRLVSGVVDAVIVTEATERSGTVSTVTHALSQNKDVFAVPGPITSLLSAGPNRFLAQGAHVCTSAQDVLDIIAPEIRPEQTLMPLGDTPLEQAILTLIQQGTRDTSAMADLLTDHSASDITQALTMLELNGVITIDAGNASLTSTYGGGS